MNYPLDLKFKLIAISSQLSVTDATGALVMYVKQKAFKLKDDITVFRDDAQTQPLYHLKADRVIDFSARFHITDSEGRELGYIKREGVKSLWKAHYDVFDGDRVVYTATESNPWIKVADAVLSEVPVVGIFTGFLFQPAYDLKRPDGTTVLRLKKRQSFAERRFRIESEVELSPNEEARALLGLLLLVLLERARG